MRKGQRQHGRAFVATTRTSNIGHPVRVAVSGKHNGVVDAVLRDMVQDTRAVGSVAIPSILHMPDEYTDGG